MLNAKKLYLEIFSNFLDSLGNKYGKCYFKLVDAQECQGWIIDIGDDTFEYLDSGPLAKAEPYFFSISNIDIASFSYWDEEITTWTDYFEPNAQLNRRRTKEKTKIL